ncbi:MAG: insulinase family protein [Leadbetterella sp.]|nr:insulinase family protein [Leadbetterella sp.]
MKRQIFSLVLTLCISTWSFAQNINLTDKLPMDPAVKVGKLPNGLTYYIRKNVEPKNRAELRLVIKAGSILETEPQRGLAHFMEHMNFNGTKNFPKNELVNFLEKSGIKFGADLNAYTSFDETVYMLPVPTDTLAKFEKYLSVLADWSGNATLDHSEIDKERGVVMEEARLGKGARQRINEKLYPVLFRGSRYAERLPIGLESVIQNAPYDEFKKFKEQWYRPDLEAVVAVGDFDPAVVEGMIKKLFGGFKNPKNAPARTEYKVPLSGGTDAIVITDKEQPYSMVQLFYLQPERKEITGANRREAMIRSLFNTMISRRLSELQQKADPPFQFGMSGYSSFLAGLDALNAIAVAKGNDVEKALIAVLDENQRAAQFGFTQGELDRAKLSYKTGVEKQFAERDKTNSASFVDELVQCFLDNVVMTDIAFDKTLMDQYLDGIKLEEVNAFVKQVITKENRVLALMGPEAAKDVLPTADRLKQLLDNTGTNITAYVDEAVAASLVAKVPAPGKIRSEKQVPEVGVTEIVFENGVKVNLKPTDFKNDEIVFRGTRWGGTSLYPDADADNATYASFVASSSGNGTLTSPQLTKFMSGKVARANASVGNISEGFSGMSNIKDLETALQLVYNKFTDNHLDKEVVTGAIGNQRDYLANMEATPTPEKVYSDTLQSVIYNYHPRVRPMTSARWAALNPERAMEIFKERFADASGFEFTFVGNFDVEKIKPLLATYLGSLPSSGKKPEYKDLGIYPPKGKVSKTVKKGSEDKANVTLLFTGEYQPNDTDELLLTALGEILQIKLTEKLREEEGGVYSPYASMRTNRYPTPRYQLIVGFGCAPANVEKLITLTQEEIAKIRQNGGTREDIEKYVNNEKLNFQTNLKNNNYWLNALSDKYQKGEDIKTIPMADKKLEKVTVESTKAIAQKYLTGENFIRVVLLPEDK